MTPSDRAALRARYLALVRDRPTDESGPYRLCSACLAVLPVQRVGITVNSATGSSEFLSASDDVAERMEWVQITLGEGPVVDAYATGPVAVHDAAGAATPWPLFAREAESAGIRAMYALPLELGTIRVGVLTLYLESLSAFDADDLGDAIAIADLITAILLSASNTGELDPLDQWWDQPQRSREIHQATGMIVAQLGIKARDAYLRLQAYAFARGLLIGDVARDIVHAGLRIDADSAATE